MGLIGNLERFSKCQCLNARLSTLGAYLKTKSRSSRPEVFLRKGVVRIYSKFTGECNFIEITLRHGCSPVDLLHVFRIPFLKSTSGRHLLKIFWMDTCSDWAPNQIWANQSVRQVNFSQKAQYSFHNSFQIWS